jgi:hypothetical protein
MLEELLSAYERTLEEDKRARAIMAKAEKHLDRLCRAGLSDDDAWLRAGMNLADRRCLRASRRIKEIRKQLAAFPGFGVVVTAAEQEACREDVSGAVRGSPTADTLRERILRNGLTDRCASCRRCAGMAFRLQGAANDA